MTDSSRKPAAEEDRVIPGESFLERFHRRKSEARQQAGAPPVPATADAAASQAVPEQAAPEPQPTDADMPPLESLTADSDYRGFLSEKVSEGLRRAALRKLFHRTEFNVLDELDDYAEDFTSFTALGDLVTADMRHRIEVEARKRAEALKQTLLNEGADPGTGAPGADQQTAVAADDEKTTAAGEQTPSATPEPS